MNEPEEAWWNAVAFFRVWRGPFVAGLDGLRGIEKAEVDAVTTAEKLLGAPLPTMPPARPDEAAGAGSHEDDAAALLTALQARLADLQALVEVEALKKRVLDLYERSTPTGPLGPWAAKVRDGIGLVDVAEATPDAIASAKATLETMLAEAEALRSDLLRRVDANAEAALESVAAFDEVIRIARQEAHAIDGQLALDARRLDEWRAGVRGLLFTPLVVGGAALAVGWLAAGPIVGQQALGGGIIAGLVLATGAWALRAWRSRGRLGERKAEGRGLVADVHHAQRELERDLGTLQREAHLLAREASELGVHRPVSDHEALIARVKGPAEPPELTTLLARLDAGEGPNSGLRAAVVLCVITSVIVAVAIPKTPAPVVETAGSAASTGPARPGSAVEVSPPEQPEAEVDVPTAVAPPVEVAAPPGASPSASPPSSAPASTPSATVPSAGAWSGSMGPAKVSGTLSSTGGLVQGHLRVEGPEGTRECSVAGPVAGGRVTLASSDCTPAIRLSGRLSRDGRSISGTVTSTVTFDGHTVDAQDAWSMRAGP